MMLTHEDLQRMLGFLSVPRLRNLYFTMGGQHSYRISRGEMEAFVLAKSSPRHDDSGVYACAA